MSIQHDLQRKCYLRFFPVPIPISPNLNFIIFLCKKKGNPKHTNLKPSNLQGNFVRNPVISLQGSQNTKISNPARYLTASLYSQNNPTAAHAVKKLLQRSRSIQLDTVVNISIYFQVAAKEILKSGVPHLHFFATYLPQMPQ